MAALHPIRLLKSYRGYRAGTVIRATPGLAEHLVETGAGVRESQGSLLDAAVARPERAVAVPAVETRVIHAD
jgi:hypothetical protein